MSLPKEKKPAHEVILSALENFVYSEVRDISRSDERAMVEALLHVLGEMIIPEDNKREIVHRLNRLKLDASEISQSIERTIQEIQAD
jgi:hypothetical protein